MQRSQVSQNQQGIDPRRKESQHKKSRDMSFCNFPDLKREQQAFRTKQEAEIHSDANFSFPLAQAASGSHAEH